MSDSERAEQPTAQRRKEARREGRVAKSRDLVVAMSLLGVFLVLEGWGSPLAERTLLLTRGLLAQVNAAPEIMEGQGLVHLSSGLVRYLVYCSLPIALASCAVVVIGQIGQGAWVFVPQSVAPQLGRVLPLEGTRRLVSARSCFRGIFAALKLLVVGAALWKVARSWLEIDGSTVALATSWTVFWKSLIGFGLQLSFCLVLLAVLDYAVQRWLHERSLRMTRDEIREEAQRQEGDQSIKDRRRRFLAASGTRGESAPTGRGDGV